MQIETIGQYQLHLVAHEMPGGRWDPFVSVFHFDAGREDFECVLDKRHVPGHFESYQAAIDAASRAGNTLIRERAIGN